MDSIVQKLLEPRFFDTFINENMRLSTYVAEWKTELGDLEYSGSKVYQATLAEYQAAMVGSVIDKNGEKPTHVMPSINQLMGSLAHIADEWQYDNDRLDQFYTLEGRYKSRKANYTQEQNTNEWQKLVRFLFDPFEKAIIAPHKRIDMLYFEGLFNGTQTVSRTNNVKSNVAYTYDLNIQKFYRAVADWGSATSTPIADIMSVCDWARAHGRSVRKIRMSVPTFRKMCKSNEITQNIVAKTSKADIKNTSVIGVDVVNAYLEGVQLPTIQLEKDRFSTLADGTTINLTKDDRVVFMFADKVAKVMASDPLEVIDPLPNKTYSQYDGNLVGFWRDKNGRFIDYDMWACPVFTGKNEYAILVTDAASA